MTDLRVAGAAVETLASLAPNLNVAGIAVELLVAYDEAKVSLLALQPFSIGPLAVNSATTIDATFGITDEFCVGSDCETFCVPADHDFAVPGGRKC